jgi:hypothetical protein
MTRPRGKASESTPGEDPLAGRHVPRSRRPANARDDESAPVDADGTAAVGEAEDLGAPATDDLLDRRERRVSSRRKAPGPTRARPEDGRETSDEAPAVPPTDPDS